MGFWDNFTFFQGAQRGYVRKKGIQMPATSEKIRFINQDVHSDTFKEEKKTLKRANSREFTAYFDRLLPVLSSREESVSVRKLLLGQ